MFENAEIRQRAERRAGEPLRETVKRGGARKSKSTVNDLDSLADHGITKDESSKWQKLQRAAPRDLDGGDAPSARADPSSMSEYCLR